jgi:hypothetical protein
MSASILRLAVLVAALALAAPASARLRPGADPDHDGLTNRYERLAHTSPHRVDSDGDGIPDGLEDFDRDGVNNLTEQLARTNPARRDSNRNHVPDGREDPDRDGMTNHLESVFAMNPRRADSDGDGIRDGDEHAGWVQAVDGPVVTIRLAAGGALAATLGDPSALDCDAGADVSDPPAGDLEPFLPGDDPADTGDDDPPPLAQAAQAGECTSSLRVGAKVAEAEVDATGPQPIITWIALA